MGKVFLLREGINAAQGESVEDEKALGAWNVSYDLIGCDLLEPVYTLSRISRDLEGIVMLVDEEGIYNDSRLANIFASMLAGVPIVGNAVIVRENGDEVEYLTDEDIELCEQLVRVAGRAAGIRMEG